MLQYLEFVQECGTEEDESHSITSGNARTLIQAWNFQQNRYNKIYDSWYAGTVRDYKIYDAASSGGYEQYMYIIYENGLCIQMRT